VERYRFPDRLYLFFGDVMNIQELPSGIRTVNFKPFVWAGKLLDQTKIMERSRYIKKFGIEAQLPLSSLLGCKQINPKRVIE
jgi:hypothetical protein